jgi:hypothetical protein
MEDMRVSRKSKQMQIQSAAAASTLFSYPNGVLCLTHAPLLDSDLFRGKGPGSVCTLCLPTEPCIESKQSTFSGYYCYNPSYLEVLDATINQTQYPYNYVDLLPTAGQKAGWIILGTSIALVVLSLGCVPECGYFVFDCYSTYIFV